MPRGKAILAGKWETQFNYPPAGLCVVLAERSAERNILATDCVPIGHGILGNWTRKAWFDWVGGRITRAVAVWVPVGRRWGQTGLAIYLMSCILGHLYLLHFVLHVHSICLTFSIFKWYMLSLSTPVYGIQQIQKVYIVAACLTIAYLATSVLFCGIWLYEWVSWFAQYVTY